LVSVPAIATSGTLEETVEVEETVVIDEAALDESVFDEAAFDEALLARLPPPHEASMIEPARTNK